MKTGILTFHRCINYGSYWQARCLAGALQKMGHHVVILDHQSARVNRAEWKCAMQPVLPTPVSPLDIPLYRKKIDKFFCAFASLPLSQAFPLEDPSQMDEYDLVIVGSDEVWNLSHPWYGYYPIFFGEGIRAKHLISYAASFGNYDVTWKPDPVWINKLRKFEKISVRDENSQTIIKNILGYEPEMVLDPCLLLPVEPELSSPRFTKEPYVAVYGHNFSAFFIRRIREWAGMKKIPLVSIGYRNHWADEQWLTADPFEFASFITHSEAVVTNFFHGCVFALNNSKPFVCETTPYRSHKVRDLMMKTGGEKHIMHETTPLAIYNSRLTEPLDNQIHLKINYLRKASSQYLEQALTRKTSNYYEAGV